MQYVPSSADVCPKFHWGFTLGLAKGLFGAGPWFKVSLGLFRIGNWVISGVLYVLTLFLESSLRLKTLQIYENI